MPCIDDRGEREEERRLAETIGDLKKEAKKKQDRLDLITRLLCELSGKVVVQNKHAEDDSDIIEFSDELSDWWEKHKEVDKKRLAAEKRAAEKKAKEQKKLDDEELALYNRLHEKYGAGLNI